MLSPGYLNFTQESYSELNRGKKAGRCLGATFIVGRNSKEANSVIFRDTVLLSIRLLYIYDME